MKTFVSFFIAAVMVGLALFVILHWLFKMDIKDAWIASFSGAFADFVVSYIREYTNSRKKDRVKEHY